MIKLTKSGHSRSSLKDTRVATLAVDSPRSNSLKRVSFTNMVEEDEVGIFA